MPSVHGYQKQSVYIRAIISSKYGKLFLSEKETAELIDDLGDVPDIPLNDYLISVPSRNHEYNDKFIADIRLLLIAIREGKEIIYSNKTRTAVYENMHGYPIRIEYSALYDLFQLSLEGWETCHSNHLFTTYLYQKPSKFA
ncbi:hypothetical protein [Ruminococcus sp.]|uniref:hypothetical protein n=1 Tax=Ruminococcus sp. TaxID=41978 RepID=UPI0025D4254E|nr:hypothetical protein [Ruminococcus sp.]MCR4638280.1 hypothetical protein [Ruminococcus sp.]